MKPIRLVPALASLLIVTLILASAQEKKNPPMEKAKPRTQAHSATTSSIPAPRVQSGMEAKQAEESPPVKKMTAEDKAKASSQQAAASAKET